MENNEKLDKFFEMHQQELEKGFVDDHDKWDVTFNTTNTLVAEYSNMYNIFNEENPIDIQPYKYNEFCKVTIDIVKKTIYTLDLEELTSVTEQDFINYLFTRKEPSQTLIEASEGGEASRRAAIEIINSKIREKMKEIYKKILLPELVVNKVGLENVMKIKKNILQAIEDEGDSKNKDLVLMMEFYKVIEKMHNIE